MDHEEEVCWLEEWARGGDGRHRAAGILWSEVERRLREKFRQCFPDVDVDDAFQEAFINCDEAVRNGEFAPDGPARFPTWAGTIIRRRLLDARRNRGRRKVHANRLQENREFFRLSSDPSDLANDQERVDSLEQAIIDWLDVNRDAGIDREVIERWLGAKLVNGKLKWNDPVPQIEIARDLGVDPNRIRVLVKEFRKYFASTLPADAVRSGP